MGLYEWVLLGAMFAVIIGVSIPSFLVERHKNKKLRDQITNEIVCVRTRKWTWLIGLIVGALVLFGGTFTTIYCSITIETPPKDMYAVLMALMAFTVLVCLLLPLLAMSHFTVASEEGVWVSRVFMKPKLIHYEEIYSITDATPYRAWNDYFSRGNYIVFKEHRQKAFSLTGMVNDNVEEMLALLRKRAPRLKRWGDDEIFPL